MGRRFGTVILGVLTACAVMAQVRTSIIVVDDLDGRAVPEVAVEVEGTLRGSTDTQGAFSWSGSGSSQRVRLVHTAFHDTALALGPGYHVVRYRGRTIELGMAHVGRGAPETVYLRRDLHAADLLINEEGVWVLAYERPRLLKAEGEARASILRGTRLVLLDSAFREIASCPVPEDVLGLRRDLHGRVLIEGVGHAFHVSVADDAFGRLLFLGRFALDTLRSSVLPWTDSVGGAMLGSRYDQVLPLLEHVAHDRTLGATDVFCSVADTFMLSLFRSEYKYLRNADKVRAMELADELGVDKELVAGYMRGFQHNSWFKPLYAPMFVVGDTLLVFDHANGILRKYDGSRLAAGSVELDYLNARTQAMRVLGLMQDRATRRIYAHGRSGAHAWLAVVDPVTGGIGRKVRVTHPWPERLQVHDDAVYYVYRPTGGVQRNAIYRERLR